MNYYDVDEERFKNYGQILLDYDFTELIKTLQTHTPMPETGFIYQGSCQELESLPVFQDLQNRVFGGMPMQLGYCNGYNDTLNCLEYHTCSELCIMAEDVVLLLGQRSDIDRTNYIYDTARVEAFLVPAGTGIELYATTLHYAPCNVKPGKGYHVANGLLYGTNGECPVVEKKGEGQLLAGCNKWLLTHPDSPEVKEGAYIGLKGENIKLY
ncbi:DUF4867 family protein [Faecalicatena contorta]|uniref:DUF4867 family protein n=1 Tax=Faecalicatena contorta TaxID=39482 RepID=UPI0018992648|nr:DUF4867 family protein [Faecalicatena contorta]